MPTLHIVRQSAFNTNDFFQCSQVIKDSDTLVFTDDGCYNFQHPLMNSIKVKQNIKVNILSHHAKARGLSIDTSELAGITMHELVSLTFDNDRVITWQ